jgi:hypothetical protein
LFKNKAPGNAFNPFLGLFLTPQKKKKTNPNIIIYLTCFYF